MPGSGLVLLLTRQVPRVFHEPMGWEVVLVDVFSFVSYSISVLPVGLV